MKKFRILTVDNDDSFRQILKTTLRVSLPTVAIDEATGGIEALQKIDAFLPDLIFMDIQLPGENGLTLTRKIKATHPNTIIVILTSYDKPEYREVAIRNGADRFLVKTSLNPKELEELVKYYFWKLGFDFTDIVKRDGDFFPKSSGADLDTSMMIPTW